MSKEKIFTIVLTRNSEKSSLLRQTLLKQGLNSVELPLLKINYFKNQKLIEFLSGSKLRYSGVIFTSLNALISMENKNGESVRIIRKKKYPLLAVGDVTADALQKCFPENNIVVPKNDFSSGGLVCELAKMNLEGKRFLYPGTEDRDLNIEQAVSSRGGIVDFLPNYESVTENASRSKLNDLLLSPLKKIILFFSPSAVKSFFDLAEKKIIKTDELVFIAIGKKTLKAADGKGVKCILAKSATSAGVIESLKNYITNEN